MTYKGCPLRDWVAWWLANKVLSLASHDFQWQIAEAFDQYLGSDEWRA